MKNVRHHPLYDIRPVVYWGNLIVEFAVITLDPETKQPRAKIYRPAEIDALLASEGLTKKDDDAEMKTA